jgi:hypothetical protein
MKITTILFGNTHLFSHNFEFFSDYQHADTYANMWFIPAVIFWCAVWVPFWNFISPFLYCAMFSSGWMYLFLVGLNSWALCTTVRSKRRTFPIFFLIVHHHPLPGRCPSSLHDHSGAYWCIHRCDCSFSLDAVGTVDLGASFSFSRQMVARKISACPPHSWDVAGAYAAVLVVRSLDHVSISVFSL